VRSIVKIRKMEARSEYRNRFRQNVPGRKGIANLPSSWFVHEYMAIGKDVKNGYSRIFEIERCKLKNRA
jgi:hypothetical protein